MALHHTLKIRLSKEAPRSPMSLCVTSSCSTSALCSPRGSLSILDLKGL